MHGTYACLKVDLLGTLTKVYHFLKMCLFFPTFKMFKIWNRKREKISIASNIFILSSYEVKNFFIFFLNKSSLVTKELFLKVVLTF